MATETLKSYLISIGYKVDQISQRQADDEARRLEERAADRNERAAEKRAKAETKEATEREKSRMLAAKKEQERREATLKGFRDLATQAAAFAVKTVAVVEATALGVVYAVDKAAQSYERLSYLSQRSGSSAGNTKAFGYASSQLGSSKGGAEASLEAFGKHLRTNGSGYAEALQRIGVKTRDANGQLRDSTDLAVDLGDALRNIQKQDGKFGYARSIAQAQTFGFDENQTRALVDPRFRGFVAQQKSDQKAVGADPDAAAKSATAFEQSMRHLLEVLDAIGTKISTVLFEKLKPLLDDLTKWFLANGKEVAEIIGRVADDLVSLAKAIANELAGADWNKILGKIEALANGLGFLLSKLGGEAGLVVLLGLLALRLSNIGNMLLPPWLSLVRAAGVAALANTAETVYAIQTSKPGANDIYVDPETGYAQKVAPGTGNQVVGQGDGKFVDRALNWAKQKLGFGPDASALTGADTPFKRFVSQHEGTNREGYDTVFAHGKYLQPPKAITDMTIAEIADYQEHGRRIAGTAAYPVGRAQFVRSTLLDLARQNNIDINKTKLTPELQEKFFDQIIARRHGNPAELRQEFDSLRGVGDAEILNAIRARDAPAKPALSGVPPMPSAPTSAGAVPQKVSLGPSPVQRMAIANSMRSNLHVAHTPTFNIHGDAGGARIEQAAVAADRGPQDLLRNIQSAEA